MNRTVSVLKFITAALLLFVMIPNEKFIAPVFLWLYIFLIGMGGLLGMAISAGTLAAIIYILFSARKRNQLSDLFSIIAIFVLYIPICIAFRNIIIYSAFISWFSYWLFIAISICTEFFLIKRLIANKYDA